MLELQVPIALLDTVKAEKDWIHSDSFFCSGYSFSLGLSNEGMGGELAVGVLLEGPALDFVPGVYGNGEKGISGVVVSFDEFHVSASKSIPLAGGESSFKEVRKRYSFKHLFACLSWSKFYFQILPHNSTPGEYLQSVPGLS